MSKSRRRPARVPGTTRGRSGEAFEKVVADVARVMDPHATVTQGEWVMGPDGRRDRDVLVEGTVDGARRRVLIECKDYNPRRGGVGIDVVDALESKRHDVGVDAAVLCSNAGFTADATRKATRVGIGLVGVMRKGDARIRFLIPESLYTRRVRVESLVMRFRLDGEPVDIRGAPFDEVLHEGVPLGNWILRRALLVLHNPVVKGELTATHALVAPVTLELPTGSVTVDQIDFEMRITGGWYVQEVTLDASAGFYDWIRRRVRLEPGPGKFHINDVNPLAGSPVDRPPEYMLSSDLLEGETLMKLMTVEGIESREPVPDIDALVKPEDLNLEIEGLQPDWYTSDPEFRPHSAAAA